MFPSGPVAVMVARAILKRCVCFFAELVAMSFVEEVDYLRLNVVSFVSVLENNDSVLFSTIKFRITVDNEDDGEDIFIGGVIMCPFSMSKPSDNTSAGVKRSDFTWS